MYADEAIKLVREAKRSLATESVQSYNDESIRLVCREVRQLRQEFDSILDGPHHDALIDIAQSEMLPDYSQETERERLLRGLVCRLVVLNQFSQRNKRCLYAYHHQRIERLKELWWQGGGQNILTGVEGTRGGSLKSNVSTHETDFMKAYTRAIQEFSSACPGIDTSASLEPPTDLYIHVRVLKDAGEIQTEMGAINLRRNNQFFIRRSDVDRLLQQGYLVQVDVT